MIKLQKGDEPKVLRDNALVWLADLKVAIASGDKKMIKSKKSLYNHPSVKAAVIKETFGKCAYCEADVLAVSHGDIEHIFPKSLDVDVTFSWSNLSFSCQLCNQNKSDKDPNLEKIVDPYSTDPEPYITFVGSIAHGNGTVEGIRTVLLLKLNRAELQERRSYLFSNLVKQLEAIKMARTEEEKEILISDFEENELLPQKEFSALRRDFWRHYKPQ